MNRSRSLSPARVRNPVVAGGLVLVALLGSCAKSGQGDETAAAPPPIVVEVEKVEPSTIRELVDFVGQLEAEETVMVRPEISGVIESHHFEEGQRVEKGQVLFRLKNGEQKAALREAQARANLAADVHRRMKELSEQRIASEAELVRVARELDVAEAAVERARVELARTEIRAPFDGYAGARLVSPGDGGRPRTDLVRVDAVDRLKLLFGVPEPAVPLAREGLKFSVKVAEYPGESFPGEVYFVAPALNPETRRLLVKGVIANPGRRLRPGLFANVNVQIEEHAGALAVPDSAIVYEGDGTFVWRMSADGHAEKVPVEVGIREGGRLEIRSGLRPGDVVVSAGTNKVFPGAVLQPTERKRVAETDAAPEEHGGS